RNHITSIPLLNNRDTGDNTDLFGWWVGGRTSAMKLLSKIEKFIDIMMSFSTLIGFCSTLYLVWLFINTPPQITVSTTNVGAPGIPGYKITSYVIQGVPFFWIFTSLVSLSAGHTYTSSTPLIPTISRRNTDYNTT